MVGSNLRVSLFGLVLFALFVLPGVFADTPVLPDYVKLVSGSAEGGPDSAVFAFIQGESATEQRAFYKYDGRYGFPDFVGEQCRVGEFIVPVRCRTQWGDCERVFTQDYLKTSDSDLVPLVDWKDADWYLLGREYRPYDGYYCKYANPQSDVDVNGRFVGSLRYPAEVRGGESVTIRGSYYVTRTGPFVLEAVIDPRTQQPLNVIQSSVSSCDGSSFWAGSEIYGVAGQTYEFAFTVRAPTEEGRYVVQVHAWDKCWEDGGTELHNVRATIDVTSARCDLVNVVSDLGSAIAKTSFPIWNLYSPLSRDIINLYGCAVDDVAAFCGSVDSDSDGIPDGCDYCPQTKGVPGVMNGCHPCFGMDVYGVQGQQCYRENYEDYGIPDRLLPILNPVVEQNIYCDGSRTLVTENVRLYGDSSVVDRTTCSSPQTCVSGDSAYCGVPDSMVSLVGEDYLCSSGNVVLRRAFSDGTSDIKPVERCEDSCVDGACVSRNTLGGLPVIGGDSAVNPVVRECSVDAECSAGSFCLSGLCSEPSDWCQSDADCSGGLSCLGGVCNAPFEAECTVDFDCSTAEFCVDGFCLEEVSFVDDRTGASCSSDLTITCPSGGQVVTDLCVSGRFVPSGRNCEGGEAGLVRPGIGDRLGLPALSEREVLNFGAVGVILLVAVGFLWYYAKSQGSVRRRRR